MDKKTISQPLYKRRSLTACMENALQLLRANWLKILKASWIPLLLYAAGEAIVISGASSLETGAGYGWVLAGLLLILLGSLSFFGLFYHWIAYYKEHDEFNPLDFRKNIRPVLRQAGRFLVVHIPCFVLFVILSYIAMYSWLSQVKPIPHSLPLWVGIVAFLVLIYLSIPLTVFCFDYLVGKHSYYQSFIKGITTGTRRWGLFFALGFMVMILYWITSLIIGLPLEISMVIEFMNSLSMTEGNAYALPGFFPVVKFLLTLIVTFITEGMALYPLLSLVLLYTSVECQQKERIAYEKQQNELDKTKKV